jgi:hypothetical protein
MYKFSHSEYAIRCVLLNRNFYSQKWIFKVKDSDNIRDKTVAEGIVDVDDFVAKGEKVNVTGLKDHEGNPVSGSLFVQKTTPFSFTLYARYAIAIKISVLPASGNFIIFFY